MTVIDRAVIGDMDMLAPLYDNYRVFYRQPKNLEGARDFLTGTMTRREAVIYLAKDADGQGAGFTLLYPSYSSVSMARVYTLNDLYVDQRYRKKGIATALLSKAVSFARDNGAIRLHLETEVSNVTAQALYEKEGWVRDLGTYHYSIQL